MRKLFIISSFAFLICCKSAQTETFPIAETPAEKTPEIVQVKTPEISLDNLTKEQKKKLDKALPPKVREFLDNAEELELLVNVDKETKKQNMILFNPPNTVAKITDTALKKAILDSFYFDTATGGDAAGCWMPQHRLRAESKGKTFEITTCYHCNSYHGSSSFGKIYGTLGGLDSKSLILLNEAIEKYGVDMQ